MPTPKAGTVTNDVAKAITEVKGGKIEFKIDKHGVINTIVGKLSFQSAKINREYYAILSAIIKAKACSAKGVFLRSLAISSTMGPGMKIDLPTIPEIQGAKE